jgi:chorismate mutase
MIRGVRGAITVKENTADEIVSATEILLQTMIEQNAISAEDVASIFISATDDINSTFPAKALRSLKDWTFVPVICMRELAIPDALSKCVRVMMHVNTEKTQAEIVHAYLQGAVGLRPDLANEGTKIR